MKQRDESSSDEESKQGGTGDKMSEGSESESGSEESSNEDDEKGQFLFCQMTNIKCRSEAQRCIIHLFLLRNQL